MSTSDYLVEERDQKFKSWLQNKALRDKALEYLAQLDPHRAVEEESLVEVAISLCAVDRMLGTDDNNSEVGGAPDSTKKSTKKTMKSIWTKWTIDHHHTFENITLSTEEYDSFSGAVKEYLFEDRQEKCFKLLSLQYHTPAVPKKPGEKTKPLSNDQKLQNAIYLRECRRCWKRAKEELEDRIGNYLSPNSQEEESKSKSYDANNNNNKGKKSIMVLLNDLSLKRLKGWIEEDEDKKLKEEESELQAKMKVAKTQHEGWVKTKDSLRIRMPTDWVPETNKTMGYGKEVSGVRPLVATGATSSVELMAGSGLKFIHAARKDDLERSRKQLLKIGFVAKENFDADEQHEFRREKEENKALNDKIMLEKKLKEDSAKAYDEWIIQKELREQALKCFNLIPKPTQDNNNDFNVMRGSIVSDFNGNSMNGSGTGKLQLNSTSKICITIGKAMKRIDRTLFSEWSKWCDNIFSTYVSTVLWDFFPPTACDIHSTSYSQVRDSFLKLLRPGVDYYEAFTTYAERLAKKRENRVGNYDRLIDEEKQKLVDDMVQEMSLKKDDMVDLLRQLGIAMKELEMRLLIDAFDSNQDGVITGREFLDFIGPKRDKKSGSNLILNQRCCWNTTCKITFMSNAYTVSAPTKRFLREEFSKENNSDERKSQSDSKYDDDYEDEYNNERKVKSAASVINENKVIVKELKTGEKRIYTEVNDRNKREKILKKLGLLKNDDNKNNKNNKNDHVDEDYDDQFEDDADKSPERPNNNNNNKSNNNVEWCEFSSWSTSNKKEGLRFLMEYTKEARQEELLKNLISNGVPPKSPQLWNAMDIPLEGGNKNKSQFRTFGSTNNSRTLGRSSNANINRTSNNNNNNNNNNNSNNYHSAASMHDSTSGDDCTELHLCWEPAKDDLVSFFSIEFGGSINSSKLGEIHYYEVHRDPPDADFDAKFTLNYVMKGLQPATSYNFRIRAFNGFGPGDYTYKTFTTRVSAPSIPRIIRISSDAVTLKWLFSHEFNNRLSELKLIFSLADSDKSGLVSREELTALLDECASNMPHLKSFLNKSAKSLGLDLTQGYGALFDEIEGDDDGGLSYDELETFFMKTGWGDVVVTNNGNVNQDDQHQTGNGVGVKPGEISYVIEKCESEYNDTYKEILRTSLGQCSINHLTPGSSYRFRLYAINANGYPGPCSGSVLVHTLLETPPIPGVIGRMINKNDNNSSSGAVNTATGITPYKITLNWKKRKQYNTSRDQTLIDKMLHDWAGTHGDDDGGVSIEAAFAKYDENSNGEINAPELEKMLVDLGVQVTKERLAEAFATLDTNKDGIITYNEFAVWWRRDDVNYTLKRSDEIMPHSRRRNIDGDFLVNQSTQQLSNNSQSQMMNRSLSRNHSRNGNGNNNSMRLNTIAEENSATLNDFNATNTFKTTSSIKARPKSASSRDRVTNKIHSSSQSINQSVTGGGGGVAGGGGGSSKVQVGVPKVVYFGNATKCEVAGLIPNQLYHMRLRYVGSRSNSMLSPPLIIMTTPLPPTKPIIIELTNNSIRIKWYPFEYGAYKFIVQAKAIVNNNNNNNNNNRGNVNENDGWNVVYHGSENTFSYMGLASDTKYHVRVLGMNCQGIASEPSPVLSFFTLPRDNNNMNYNSKNISSLFGVECTGDICVGDTILITERIFKKILTNESISINNNSNNSNNNKNNTNNAIKKSMNMSITSLTSGGVSITPNGTFIGERIIAAYVSKDNYRTTRDYFNDNNIDPKNNKKVGKYRELWLEVVWQRCSNEESKSYEVKIGEVLKRNQSHLELFEVYRSQWKQEEFRKSFADEWNILKDCYVAVDL
eukprot:gene11939-15981_t